MSEYRRDRPSSFDREAIGRMLERSRTGGVRREVLHFAVDMEKRLQEHDSADPNYEKIPIPEHIRRAFEKVAAVQAAMDCGDFVGVRKHAADAANYLMFIKQNYTGEPF